LNPALRPAKILQRCLVLAAFCVIAVPAQAGVFSVTPVRIFMSPRDRATAVTITNEGDDELVMQADVYRWAQKPSGEDDLALSEDLILSPPILKLAPHARQVVRLARVGAPPSGTQLSYRLIVREVPEARKAPKDVQLQVALAFSLPVFITPPNLKRDLRCSARRQAADALAVTCENAGHVYAQPRSLEVATPSGAPLAMRESAAYLLPGIKRGFDLRAAPGATIPAGALKLAVTFDDGTTQAFDLSVPN
jgi:fimbrial chaperone protein